jgi:hypothetical protein
MRYIWVKLSIPALLKCRLVCKVWCSAVLHNSVWIPHVNRFKHFYPWLGPEFIDKFNKQNDLEGGQLVIKVAPKRRRVGNVRNCEDTRICLNILTGTEVYSKKEMDKSRWSLERSEEVRQQSLQHSLDTRYS